MQGYVPIENDKSMARDLHSKGLVKTDLAELEAHRNAMRRKKAREEELNSLKDRVERLERMLKGEE